MLDNASPREILWVVLILPALLLSAYNVCGASMDIRRHQGTDLQMMGWAGLCKVLCVLGMAGLVVISGAVAMAAPEPERPGGDEAADIIYACLIVIDGLITLLAATFAFERGYVVPHVRRLVAAARREQAGDRRPGGQAAVNERFRHVAGQVSEAVGSPWAFGFAVLIIVTWAATGPLFGFGDTWQLIINTGTTIVTFLMVFLIQNTQNRDARAVHVKLDAVIDQLPGSNRMIGAEDLPDAELEAELLKRRAAAKDGQA